MHRIIFSTFIKDDLKEQKLRERASMYVLKRRAHTRYILQKITYTHTHIYTRTIIDLHFSVKVKIKFEMLDGDFN